MIKQRNHHGSSGSRKHHMRKKTRLLIIVAGVMYILILAAVFVLPKLLGEEKKQDDQVGSGAALFDNAVKYEEGGHTYTYRQSMLTNILVLGVDRNGLNTQDAALARSGAQADFLVLLVIDREKQTVTPIQLDRDSMVEMDVYTIFGSPAGTKVMQLCLAQAFGKNITENCENTVKTVSRMMLNIPIDHYVVYDMSAINEFNDLLGGVTVTVTDDLTPVDPALIEGTTLTLHGEQAEHFVRARMTVGDGMNSSRMRRQRDFMNSALTLLKEKCSSSGSFATNMINNMKDNYVSNMAAGALANTLNRCLKYEILDFVTPTGEHMIGSDGFMEFHYSEESLKQIVLDACFN